MTAVALRLGPAPSGHAAVAALPVRLPLSFAAVVWLADAAGARLPWQRSTGTGTGRAEMERRLSGIPEPDPHDEAVEELSGLGAVNSHGRVRPALLAALAVFSGAEVAVDVDLGRRVAGGSVGLHAWHRRSGDRVTWLTVTGGRVELGWCDLSGWSAQLTGLAAGGSDDPAAAGPRPGLSLPLPHLLATGEAVRTGRDDLLAELLRHPGLAGEADQVHLVHHGVRARLRATVAGRGPAGDRRIGLVSWLRFADGWRSLVPVARTGAPWVRLDPVPPSHFAAEVARLERGVRGC